MSRSHLEEARVWSELYDRVPKHEQDETIRLATMHALIAIAESLAAPVVAAIPQPKVEPQAQPQPVIAQVAPSPEPEVRPVPRKVKSAAIYPVGPPSFVKLTRHEARAVRQSMQRAA